MPRVRPVVPPYRHHKHRGLAFTIVNGRTVYLGPYGSPASREKHARVVREAAATAAAAPVTVGPKVDPAALTVAGVLAAFWAYGKTAYPYDPSYDGKRPSGELGNYHDAMRPVLKLFASTPTVEFGPKALRLVRDEMIAMGWCRNVVNRAVVRVRTMFKSAVGQEMLPGEVEHRLHAVEALHKGHKGVRDTADVEAVPADVLAATLAHCSRRLATMIRLQLATGMRSGNLLDMRTADVDVTGGPHETGNWAYKPRRHKTQHRGHKLLIRLGPTARELLAPYLRPDRPEAYVFSPAEEMAEVRAARAAARVTPASCGNRPGSNVKRSPGKVAGDRYTPSSYA